MFSERTSLQSDVTQVCFLQKCLVGRAVSEVYHTQKIDANGKRRWQGGKNLSESATFTYAFCAALFNSWRQSPDVISGLSVTDDAISVLSSQSDGEGQA